MAVKSLTRMRWYLVPPCRWKRVRCAPRPPSWDVFRAAAVSHAERPIGSDPWGKSTPLTPLLTFSTIPKAGLPSGHGPVWLFPPVTRGGLRERGMCLTPAVPFPHLHVLVSCARLPHGPVPRRLVLQQGIGASPGGVGGPGPFHRPVLQCEGIQEQQVRNCSPEGLPNYL